MLTVGCVLLKVEIVVVVIIIIIIIIIISKYPATPTLDVLIFAVA